MIIRPFILLIVGLFLLGNIPVLSQEENCYKIEKCARLQGGLLIQFQDKDNSDSPGMDFQYCYGIKTGKRFGVGFGGGFQYYKEESFVPIMLDLVWFFGQNPKHSFIYFNGGYSLGWSEEYEDYINSSFSGGPALGIGYGKMICIKEQYRFFINAGYHYQNAQLQYELEIDQTKYKSLHYHMIIINLGLMLEQ
jgi:hypothetical protein